MTLTEQLVNFEDPDLLEFLVRSKMTNSLIPKNITKKQAGDTGMAMVLILLLLGYFLDNNLYFKLAIPVLVLNMIYPMLFYPVAMVWLTFSNVLGTIMSKVLLTLLYVILVLPVGLVRKLMGKDSMNIKNWKKSTASVMKVRNKKFSAADLTNPF